MPRDEPRADWHCRRCKTTQGDPVHNYGHRLTCRQCGIHKGSAYLRPAPHPEGPARRTAPRPGPGTGPAKDWGPQAKQLEAKMVAAVANAVAKVMPVGGACCGPGAANPQNRGR